MGTSFPAAGRPMTKSSQYTGVKLHTHTTGLAFFLSLGQRMKAMALCSRSSAFSQVKPSQLSSICHRAGWSR